jgi:hypothetical protein
LLRFRRVNWFSMHERSRHAHADVTASDFTMPYVASQSRR